MRKYFLAAFGIFAFVSGAATRSNNRLDVALQLSSHFHTVESRLCDISEKLSILDPFPDYFISLLKDAMKDSFIVGNLWELVNQLHSRREISDMCIATNFSLKDIHLCFLKAVGMHHFHLSFFQCLPDYKYWMHHLPLSADELSSWDIKFLVSSVSELSTLKTKFAQCRSRMKELSAAMLVEKWIRSASWSTQQEELLHLFQSYPGIIVRVPVAQEINSPNELVPVILRHYLYRHRHYQRIFDNLCSLFNCSDLPTSLLADIFKDIHTYLVAPAGSIDDFDFLSSGNPGEFRTEILRYHWWISFYRWFYYNPEARPSLIKAIAMSEDIPSTLFNALLDLSYFRFARINSFDSLLHVVTDFKRAHMRAKVCPSLPIVFSWNNYWPLDMEVRARLVFSLKAFKPLITPSHPRYLNDAIFNNLITRDREDSIEKLLLFLSPNRRLLQNIIVDDLVRKDRLVNLKHLFVSKENEINDALAKLSSLDAAHLAKDLRIALDLSSEIQVPSVINLKSLNKSVFDAYVNEIRILGGASYERLNYTTETLLPKWLEIMQIITRTIKDVPLFGYCMASHFPLFGNPAYHKGDYKGLFGLFQFHIDTCATTNSDDIEEMEKELLVAIARNALDEPRIVKYLLSVGMVGVDSMAALQADSCKVLRYCAQSAVFFPKSTFKEVALNALSNLGLQPINQTFVDVLDKIPEYTALLSLVRSGLYHEGLIGTIMFTKAESDALFNDKYGTLGQDDRPHCAICIEPFTKSNPPRALRKCGHFFHRKCMTSHCEHRKDLDLELECPMCRQTLES